MKVPLIFLWNSEGEVYRHFDLPFFEGRHVKWNNGPLHLFLSANLSLGEYVIKTLECILIHV